MGVGLVVLVMAPWSGADENVIVGGGSAEKAGREAYVLIKCIYIYICFEFSSSMFPLTGDFYPCVVFPGYPQCHFVFSESLPESSNPLLF